MRYLVISLFLVGCTQSGFSPPDLNNSKPADCDMFCRQQKARDEQTRKLEARGPKYKTPNQLDLKNGCKVRVVDDPKIVEFMDGPVYVYKAEIIINEWSDECSTIPDWDKKEIPEKDVVHARYK